ncbi:MAG: sulfurtransferase complex subunit TusB [Pseudohongiellaceae bacterium]
MSTLHTVNGSPDSGLLDDCRTRLGANDALLLIENGVFYATDTDANDSASLQLPDSVKCYVLREDCVARGILEHCHARFEIIDYGGFVTLCAEYDKTIAWF